MTTLSATHDANRLESIANGLSYNDPMQARTKHVLNEIAMRLATGWYLRHPAKDSFQTAGQIELVASIPAERMNADSVVVAPEELKPTPLPVFTLNSVNMQIPSNPAFTYDDLCWIARKDPDRNPTVTWATSDKQGMLVHGEMIVVTPGMVINCLVTSNG